MTSVRLLLIAAASLAMSAAPAGAAQTSGPDADVMATVDAALAASIAGDIPRLMAQYAPDCAFTDEYAPFFWSGPHAIEDYFAAGGRMYRDTQHKDGKTVLGPPSYVYVSGDRAFVVEKVSGSASVRGRPYSQAGAFAFALARTQGRWKIISQTWTKSWENMDPYRDWDPIHPGAARRSPRRPGP